LPINETRRRKRRWTSDASFVSFVSTLRAGAGAEVFEGTAAFSGASWGLARRRAPQKINEVVMITSLGFRVVRSSISISSRRSLLTLSSLNPAASLVDHIFVKFDERIEALEDLAEISASSEALGDVL